MPLGPGTKYRWKTFPSGKKVRLAFQDDHVVEVKPLHGAAKMLDDGGEKESPRLRAQRNALRKMGGLV